MSGEKLELFFTMDMFSLVILVKKDILIVKWQQLEKKGRSFFSQTKTKNFVKLFAC